MSRTTTTNNSISPFIDFSSHQPSETEPGSSVATLALSSSEHSLPSQDTAPPPPPPPPPKVAPLYIDHLRHPKVSKRQSIPELAFCCDVEQLSRSADLLYISGVGPLVEIKPIKGPMDLGSLMLHLGPSLKRILVVAHDWTLPSGLPIQIDVAVALFHSEVQRTPDLSALRQLAVVKPYRLRVDNGNTIEILKSFQANDGSLGCCAVITYRNAMKLLRNESKQRVLIIKRGSPLGLKGVLTIKYFIEAVIGNSGCIKHVFMLPSCNTQESLPSASATAAEQNAARHSMSAPENGFVVFTDDFSPLRALALTSHGELIVKPGVSLHLGPYEGCEFRTRLADEEEEVESKTFNGETDGWW